MKKISFLFLLLMISVLNYGQTLIAGQDFDSEVSWTFTPFPAPYFISLPSPNDIWGVTTTLNSGGIGPQNGANFWGMRDLDNPHISDSIVNGGLQLDNPLEHTITFDNVSVAGKTDVAISFWYSTESYGDTYEAYIEAEFFFDDVSMGIEDVFIGSSDNRTSNGWVEYVKQVPDGTTKVRVTILTYNNQDLSGVDNFRVESDRVVGPSCDIITGNTSAECDAVTEGTDTYTARLAYSGGGTDTYVVTASSGTVTGGDPSSVAEDTIVVTGVEEGTDLTITIKGTVCDEEVTITSPNCVPATALPFVDAFDYTVGESLVSQSNKWSSNGSLDDVAVSAGNLSYSGLKAPAGNSVTFEGDGNEAILNFVPVTSGPVYASFVFKVADLKPSVFTKGGYFAVMGDYHSRLFIWPDTVETTKFKVGVGQYGTNKPEDALYADAKFGANDQIFIVMGCDLTTKRIDIWINPASADFEGAAAPVSDIYLISQVMNEIGMFIIRQDTDSETPLIVMDELRVATTWAEVTPKGVVSVEQKEIMQTLVYPNPVSDGQFMIRTESRAPGMVHIYDVTGKQVYSKIYRQDEVISVEGFARGIYLIKLQGENGITTGKFIIE